MSRISKKNGLLPIFEIEVIDNRTKETDIIIFDVFVKNSFFIARYVGLTARAKIDPDFSIDENLQELYDACIYAIIKSDFYELPEN